MTLVCPQVGEKTLLQDILPATLVLHLYGNDVGSPPPYGTYLTTPPTGATPTVQLFELQNSNSGGSYYGSSTYAQVTMNGTWTITENSGSTVAAYAHPSTTTVNFSIAATSFSGAPFQIPTGGGTISVTPQIQLA
jgi:hypothetical protein